MSPFHLSISFPHNPVYSIISIPFFIQSCYNLIGTSNKKRLQRQVTPPAQRRHANSIMVLARSAMPGCKCPKPGIPAGNTVIPLF